MLISVDFELAWYEIIAPKLQMALYIYNSIVHIANIDEKRGKTRQLRMFNSR